MTLNETEKWAGREIALDAAKNVVLYAQNYQDKITLKLHENQWIKGHRKRNTEVKIYIKQ